MSEQAFRFWQVGLLAVNALLVWAYVISTRSIQKAAIRQAEISEQQAVLSAAQIEGLSRPILVVRDTETDLHLVNIGTGPALGIKWWYWPEDNPSPGSKEAPSGRISFLEVRQSYSIHEHPDFLLNPRRKIICMYESVGRVSYISECFQKRDTMVGKWYDHKFAGNLPSGTK